MENRASLAERTKALAIIKWTIKKYLPFSIAYWILLFLSFAGVEIVVQIVTKATEQGYRHSKGMDEFINYIPSTGFAAIAIIYSVIIAIMAFSYMHNKRSVDFFGSMPVSRRVLFFARYFAVVILTVVPLVVFGIIGGMLSGSMEAFMIAAKIVGILIITIIGNISFIAFISVCCGTVADVIVSYGVINIVYPICIIICNLFPQGIIPGFSSGYVMASVYTLGCPVAAPFVGFFGTGLTYHICWWIALSIVLMVGCYFLCKKRKAETAQNAFAFSVVEIVIKFVTCFAAGFGLGWIMAYVGEVMNTVESEYAWFIVGMVIGIMVANILLHLIFHRGLSKYKNSLAECATVAAAVIAFLLCVTSGAFGYDTRIPEDEEVVEIGIKTDYYYEFVVDGKDVLMYRTQDENVIKDVVDMHAQIVDNAKKTKSGGLYPIVSENQGLFSHYYSVSEGEINTIQVEYTLKDGRKISRSYNDFYGNVEIPNSIRNIAASDIMILEQVPAKYLESISISNYKKNDYCDIYINEPEYKPAYVEKIAEAIKRDIKEHGIVEESEADNCEYRIGLGYEKESGSYHVTADVDVPLYYSNTIKALEETGYINVLLYSMMDYWAYESSQDFEYSKTGKEVYFNLPESWNDELEVRCVPYDSDMANPLVRITDDITKCEKVLDGVYKYVIPEVEGYTFTKIMFYQYSKAEFDTTGWVPVSTGEENILTTYDFGQFMEYSDLPNCKYEWTK